MADKMTLIMFSGDFDKAVAGLTMATTAQAMETEVTIFFTFWGLNIVRKRKTGKAKRLFLQKLFSLLNKGGAGRLPLSRFNFCGLGPFMMKLLMKKKNMSDVEKLLQTARDLGVKFQACTTSMEVMGLKESDFIDGLITECVGAATYLKYAKESAINLFI